MALVQSAIVARYVTNVRYTEMKHTKDTTATVTLIVLILWEVSHVPATLDTPEVE